MPSTISGTGTAYFGRRELRADGSYVTTEFITLFYIPLVPLRSRRVREVGPGSHAGGGFEHRHSQQYIVRPMPMNWWQVLNVYLGLIGVLVALPCAFAVPHVLATVITEGNPLGQLKGIGFLFAVIATAAIAVHVSRKRRRREARLREAGDKVIFVDSQGVASRILQE